MKCLARFLVTFFFIFCACYLLFLEEDSNNDTTLACEKSNDTRLAVRKKHLDSVCSRHENPYSIEFASLFNSSTAMLSSFSYFTFEDNITMICSIQKSGSNSMRNFLHKVLYSKLNSDNNSLKLKVSDDSDSTEDLRSSFPVNSVCWPHCAKNVTKVILVRHPLDRLLSAYFYIFDNQKGKYHTGLYTWEQFVHNILYFPDEEKWRGFQKSVGNHWEPYWRSCQVCDPNTRPDYILKLESVKEDLKDYLSELGLEKYAGEFPWSNPHQGTSLKAIQFYSRLNRSTIEQLYQMYKMDHELFLYDPQPYFDMAID